LASNCDEKLMGNGGYLVAAPDAVVQMSRDRKWYWAEAGAINRV
jgi:hypothetical protein